MQQFEEPLLIFYSFSSRDTFVRGLGLTKQEGDPVEINHNNESHLLELYTFRSVHATTCSLYMNVCRAPGGQVGFMNKAVTLYTLFNGPVFIFHRELQAFAEAPPNVFVNFPIQAVLDVLRVGGVSDLEKSRMAACIGSPAPPREAGERRWPGARTRLFREEEVGHLTGLNMEVDDQQFGQLVPVLTDGDEMAAAIRLSEEEYARSLAAQKPPIPKRDWSSVLKQPEKAEPGQPQCNVCFENRASICIVSCGHQSICDACIQQLVKHTCIVCRAEFDQIVRPLVSLILPLPVKEAVEAKAKEPVKKKQRRKK